MNERKKHVAETALKLFQEKGIQHTSIQDIVKAASISKGTFYNYFTSKNDCVAEILEDLRYEASQRRIAAQIGKARNDRTIFIEQIAIFIKLQEEKHLYRLFEAILHSNEADLKKLVLKHRVHDMEWLTQRLIEVRGESVRPYAFEGVVLFTGMMQHTLFVHRYTNSSYHLETVIDILLSYLEDILEKMEQDQHLLLNDGAIQQFRSQVEHRTITKKDVLSYAESFDVAHFYEEQKDLFDAISEELQKERIRKGVLLPLLKPFQASAQDTTMEDAIQTFINMIWYYVHSY
ncbi:TetR/AcrR family transcriptional regulator [Shouchella hunanensis]|uniref:TetR/AcrR family transcriptional regulator n=1 Tax=Shouchella hunanensis TaxID=766894 RepID=A0ABY7VZS3_9BACI|nr:TetR/AcrR family transcriptional regulator [Shouchella hunanensis]WDF02213.1 TetR/AcrR family transcriptional regulator [Shouchella hunanensis]